MNSHELLWCLDLEPFWQGLGWEGENDLDDPIVRVAVWLSTQINHDACSKITTLVKVIGPAPHQSPCPLGGAGEHINGAFER